MIAFLGNLLMFIAFAYMFLPSCEMILDQMSKQVTSVFKIGLNIVYFPFIPFMIIIMLYILYDLFVEFMVFTGIGGEKYEKLMSKYDKSEAEEAVDAALEHAEQEKEMERKEGE